TTSTTSQKPMAPISQPPTETSSTTSAPRSQPARSAPQAGPAAASHWLIYALGGGLGHLTRSLSLARAARLRRRRPTVRTNRPFPARATGAAELATLEVIPASADRAEVSAAVHARLRRSDYELLVVDTFPRGIVGELPEIFPALDGRPRALVNRYLCRAYV